MQPHPAPLSLRIGDVAFALRDVGPDDIDAMLSLHRRVFGSDTDLAWFDWKYRQGHAIAVGVWQETSGTLVAHCGGIPRRLWHQGRPTSGLQIGDVMVAPEFRGILTRRGPFYHATRALYEGKLGPGRIAIGYGFPNERHTRLGVMLKLGWHRGDIASLVWDTSAVPAAHWRERLAWRWQALSPQDAAFDQAVTQAWAAMRGDGTALTLGERDPDYIRWRFVQRPDKQYRFFTLRRPWLARAEGVAVLDLAQPQSLWLDWIGPRRSMAVASRFARRAAAAAGATSLAAWASPAVEEALAGSGIAHRAYAACLGIPMASDLREQDLPGVRWWFMGGDTDFL